ncbi:MAG: anthranilate phosphoribosyltransferase [Pseudomonadota bacterium]|nr:anthranilate phosphoribosyltransferase [Pseudomonadota bacterium]
MNIQAAIAQVVAGQSLSRADMETVMRTVMQGEATEAQIGGLLVGLRMKGETIDEIVGAASVMRSLATPVDIDTDGLIDLAGTGGDGANLFNVSTAATFVVAGAGGRIAKHGNRSVSSSSGSSDVLSALGVDLSVSPAAIADSIASIGVGFMFAPMHHSAMKYAIGPRQQLAMRTIFNVLGPLTNPAGARRQVLGVFSPALCDVMASALRDLGSEHVMVVHGLDGLDEITVSAKTRVCELANGELTHYEIDPAAFGHAHDSVADLCVEDAEESAALICAALGGDTSDRSAKARSIIGMNAGAGLYVGGQAHSLEAGIELAMAAMHSGKALQTLEAFAELTQAAGGA